MKEVLENLYNKSNVKYNDSAVLITKNNTYKAVSINNNIYRDRIDAVLGVFGQSITNNDKDFKELHYYSDDFNFLNKDVILEFFNDELIYLYNKNGLYKIIKKEDLSYEKWFS